MMCYRDRCWCSFYETCKDGAECDRALTPEIQVKACASHLLISQFAEKPECWKCKKENKEASHEN